MNTIPSVFRKSLPFFLAALLFPLSAALRSAPKAAGSGTSYRILLKKSYVRFEAQTGSSLVPTAKGVIRKFSFEGSLDRANPAASKAKVTIDLSSIESETFFVSDKKLREALDTKNYPTATLETTAVRGTSDPDIFEVDVVFTFQGKRTPASVLIKTVRFDKHVRLLGEYSLAGGKGTVKFSLHLEPI